MLSQEQLERRLALAVYVSGYESAVDLFGGSTAVAGRAIIASDDGSDVFIRQVGSVSQDLIVATNSSFLNYQIIDGIDAGDRYQGIFVTNGTRRLSEALRPDFVTNGRSTFLLNDDKVLFEGITAPPTPGIEGTIELIQRDGTTSRWTFGPGGLISPTLADPNPSNLQGPGWGEPLPVGHIRPISIAGDDVFTESNRGQSGLVVTWSNPLGPSNRPTLVGASYSYQFIGPLGIETLEGATVNVPAAEPSLRRNPNLQVVQITLPGAGATLEDGIGERQSLGVITGTLRGGISFAWGSSDRIQLPAFYIDANGVLRFGGNSSVNVPAPTGGLIDIRGRLVSGSVVELEFRRWEEEVEVDDDTGGFSYESAIAIPGGPSELRLNADYLTYVREAEPNQVTFVSGHTITRGLTVDLLTPASTINIDSPVKVAVDEDIDLRATNINIRATMTSPDRLSIGRSQVARERLSIEPDYVNPYLRTPSVPSLYSFSQIRAGRAVAVVRNFGPGLGGQLTAIEPLPGFQGFGYNPSIPPVVTISGGGGSGATAVAVVSPAGTITGYLVTSPGSGYTGIPTVAVAPPIPQSRATARVVSIDAATGQVLQVEVLDPGYRYQALPRVVITPPSRDGFGVQATARAILDPEGRIVSIEIVNPGSGYTERPEVIVAEPSPPAMAERLTIAAAAAANVFEIYVGDDFGTPTPRGLARISANGSLSTQAEGIQITAILPPPVGSTAVNQQITLGPGASGAFPENFNPVGVALAGFGIREGTRVQAWDPATNTATVPLGSIASTLATPANVSLGVRSESLYLEATQADVVFEGLVNVDKQSYLFNSLPSVRHLAPFTFTTRSAATGELTGTIEGSVVDVVPGNDARTPLTGSTAFHDIDLRTRIDSLRVRAASSASDPQGPFPYRLSIEEIDRISLDAVAASSGPISVTAANGLVLTSAIDTDGDISLVARTNQIDTFANLQVTAPVRTRFGQIAISGDSVEIRNSLAVSAAAVRPERRDIVLEARAGDLVLQGEVYAVNDVVLEQVNRVTSVSEVLITAVAGPEEGDTVQKISLGRPGGGLFPLGFDPTGRQLVIQGIAPGTKILSWNPQTGTATVPLNSVSVVPPPAVGASLTPSITTVFPGVINGDLARIVADNVEVIAEGSVALRTDANRLTGTAGIGFTLSELDDITIPLLSSGGLVSLEALGVDLSQRGANPVALTATLLDVTNLVVSTPNGSARIDANTAQELLVGDAATIRSLGDKAPTMQTAGDVTIRSQAGDVTLLDAPIAGGNARLVRLVTAAPLPGTTTYLPGNPGVTPSSLGSAGSLNALTYVDAQGVVQPFWGRDDLGRPLALAAGDLVLVKDQPSARENGVYRVAAVGGGAFGSQRWQLLRDAASDTAAEMPAGTLVRVLEGPSVGRVFTIGYSSILPTLVERIGTNQLQFPELFPNFDLLRVGMIVNGSGIAPDSTISAIDPVARVVTLDVVDPGQVFSSGLGLVGVEGTGGDTITLDPAFTSYAVLAVGQAVTGPGIQPGAAITRIDPIAGQIDVATALIGPADVSLSGTALTFDQLFTLFSQLEQGQQVQLFDGEANLLGTRTIITIDRPNRSVALSSPVAGTAATARVWTPGALPVVLAGADGVAVGTARPNSVVVSAADRLAGVRVGQLFRFVDSGGALIPGIAPQPVASLTIRVNGSSVVGDVTVGFATLLTPGQLALASAPGTKIEFLAPAAVEFGVASPNSVPVDWNTWTAVNTASPSVLRLPNFPAFGDLTRGLDVYGANIPPNTVINAFDPVARTITLSSPASGAVSTVNFGRGPTARFPAADTLRLDPAFTNYERLFVGQRVYGVGIEEGAVIVSLDRVVGTISLTPRSVGTFLGPISITQRNASASPFYPERFDDWLELEHTFNDFSELKIGQRAALFDALGGLLRVVEVTGVDAMFRTVGLANGSLNGIAADVATATFLPPTDVRFGVIEGIGSGLSDLLLLPVGLAPITVTERVVRTNIGSDLTTRTVTFVVSTDGRTNDVTGSLGKMIDVSQNNDPTRSQVDLAVVDVRAGAGGTWVLRLDPLFNGYERLYSATGTSGEQNSELKDEPVFGTARMFTPTARLLAVDADAGTVTLAAGSLSNLAIEDLNRVTTVTLAIGTVNPDQLEDFRFWQSITGTFQLLQELPEIRKAMTIDGSRTSSVGGSGPARLGQVLIDGQRILRTNQGSAVTGGTQVDGLAITGPDADGTRLTDLSIGGFQRGSAIRIDGASNVVVDQVRVGRSPTGSRVPNVRGVTVTGATARDNTVLDSTLVGGTAAGIVVENGASRTYVVGGSVGTPTSDNQVGIFVAAGAGETFIGANPILPAAPITTSVPLKVGQDSLSLPRTAFATPLIGLGIAGPGIPAGTIIRGVDTVAGVVLLGDFSGAPRLMTESRTVTVTVGHFAERLLDSQAMFDQLRLPTSVPLDDVFVGQRITGTGIPDATTITAIDHATRVVRISARFTGSGPATVSFRAPARTVVRGNRTGIALRGPATRITNTDVADNSLNGIEVIAAGQQIGSPAAAGQLGAGGVPLASWAATVSFNQAARVVSLPSRFTGRGTDIGVGTPVFGTGIVPGTSVTAVTLTAAGTVSSVTLSTPTIGQVSNGTIAFGIRTGGVVQRVTLGSAERQRLFVGQNIHADGMPAFGEVVAFRLDPVASGNQYLILSAPQAGLGIADFSALAAGEVVFAERTVASNRIYGSGRYGIRVFHADGQTNSSGAPTRIVANYFGMLSETGEASPNQLGAMLVNDGPPVRYQPGPNEAVDRQANKYGPGDSRTVIRPGSEIDPLPPRDPIV